MSTIPDEPVPFHDPRRPKLHGGRPCWLRGGLTALPIVCLQPEGLPETNRWSAKYLVEAISGAYSWAELEGTLEELSAFLIEWNADPEGTTRRRFGRPVPGDPELARRPVGAPSGPGTAIASSTASAEDLGL